MISWLLILVGFVVLVYGANLLVNGASSLAAKLNVPNMVIGLTIVAFGTSAPELVVNAFAAMNGNTQIVMGNVLGSNIFNVALIVGVSALIFPLRVKTATTWIEIPLALLSAFVVLIIANDMFFDSAQSNVISRVEAIMLLAFFMIFLAYNIHVSKQGQGDEEVQVKAIPISKSIVFFVLGLVMLVVGGRLIVTYAVEIARNFGLSERIIALTIVSIGTSLPELATSIVAVTRRNVDLAVGNVVGSNIFNVFFVLGISGLFGKVEVVSENQIDIWMNIVFSFMLFLFIFTGKGRQVERWEGALFVLAYIAYLIFLF
jgi:cation:H+ antiporter